MITDFNEKRKLVGSRFALARTRAGLSQSQVAEKLKIPRPSISEIEAGRRKVSADELVEFADTYSVEIEWLAGKGTNKSDPIKDQLYLAARKMAGLKEEDLNNVIDLLLSLKPKKDKQ